MDLSIIIVNFNVKYFLEQCLCSVIKACENIEAEVFVVDNNSTDESKAYFDGRFPSVHFSWNTTNMGFAKANNSVLKEATGDHILFLNPDTIVPEDCFEKCIAIFATTKNCGALGVRMIDGSGNFLKESKRSFPSLSTSFFKLSGLALLFPSSKTFAKYYAGHLDDKSNNKVDVLAGAFMMLSREALTRVKGFDEDFFMYGEDIDLSYRIQQSGLDNYFFAGTTIIHFKGESTQRGSIQYIRMFYDAMKLFVIKHFGSSKLKLFFAKLFIDLGRILSSTSLFIRKIFIQTKKISSPLNTAVVGSQEKFDEVIHLLKYSTLPLVIKGRIAVISNDSGFAIGKKEDIAQLVQKFSINELLFCEEEPGFKFIIDAMENSAGKTGFLFHAGNSRSIVGSDDKNSNGIFIAKD